VLVKDSKVIVTGGAGFIGSHLVDLLLSRNNEVIVIDDFSSGSPKNLEQHADNKKLHIEEVSILDESAMYQLHKGIKYVFHLATRSVRLSLRQPTCVHEVNVTGTLNVLKAASAAGVDRFLYTSSSEVNGTADIVPMPEDYIFRPETIYGASKLAGEYYTQVFERSGWLSTVIVRPHNNYGPREHFEGIKGEVIPRFILWALSGNPLLIYGDGLQTRDFTYVTETTDLMLMLIENTKSVGETYNLCRGQEVSIKELAEIISGLSGIESPLHFLPGRPSDVLRLYGDNTKLKNILGMTPQIGIREGLKLTLNWFRENIAINDDIIQSLRAENWDEVSCESWLSSLLKTHNRD